MSNIFSPSGTKKKKIFNATDSLFDSNFFQSLACDRNFMSFQSYLSIKGYTLLTL